MKGERAIVDKSTLGHPGVAFWGWIAYACPWVALMGCESANIRAQHSLLLVILCGLLVLDMWLDERSNKIYGRLKWGVRVFVVLLVVFSNIFACFL